LREVSPYRPRTHPEKDGVISPMNVKKLQFIHTVNGDGSKNRKNHKKAMLTTLT